VSEHLIVVATDADAAMRFAGRSDRPVDLGPPADPSRYKPGARRWGFTKTASAPPNEAALLDKVRKLLALAGDGGATEGEASNAAAAAQRLIEQHRLDTALLDTAPDAAPRPDEPIGISTEPLYSGKKMVAWRGVLANCIARANGCQIYWHHWKELRVIGAPSRVASVRQLYAWLSTEVDRLGREAAIGMGRSYGHAWRVGCAERVGQRLIDAAKQGATEARKRAEGSGMSLVRVQQALAKIDVEAERERVKAWQRQNLKLSAGRSTSISDSGGYRDGKAAGDRIKLTGHARLGTGNARLGGRS